MRVCFLILLGFGAQDQLIIPERAAAALPPPGKRCARPFCWSFSFRSFFRSSASSSSGTFRSVRLSVCLQALLTARGHTRLRSSGRSCSVGKRHLLRHLYIKCIVLPRQARDKHRENSKQEWRFRRGLQRLPQLDRRRRCGRGWQRPCPCGLGREAGAPRCDYRACEHRG
jgi:hypothetical protein